MKTWYVLGLWLPMIMGQSYCAMEEDKKETVVELKCCVFPRYENSYTVYGMLNQKCIIAASCLLPISRYAIWPEGRALTLGELPIICGIRCICQKDSSLMTREHSHVARSFFRFFLNKLIDLNYNAARMGSLVKSYPKCLATHLLESVNNVIDLPAVEGELKITF